MINLPLLTWEVVGIWLVIGLVIYFTYSTRHSKVQALQTSVPLPK
jgi:APA family basic amino acid/polyamine antiporter